MLAPRGRRDATALGRLFAGPADGLGPALKGVPRPEVALVSPAARTAATAELVLAKMDQPPELRFDRELYGAAPEEVLTFVRALGDDVASVLVVGHNPTAHSLAVGLLAPGDKKGNSLTARQGFPTCALGVYRFSADNWKDVSPGSARLVALLAPPY